MQRELRHLMNLASALEQAAGGFVPQIVEAQIRNAEQLAGPRERGVDALGVVREDVLVCPGLGGDDGPGLGGVFEPPMVPVLAGRVLGVPARTMPVRVARSLSRHSRRQISDSRPGGHPNSPTCGRVKLPHLKQA